MQDLIDRLGELAAIKADIAAEEKTLKAALTAAGDGAYEGNLFRATVSTTERSRIDWKAIAAKLEPSRQLVTAHTSVSDVTTVRVVARNARRAA